MNVWLAARSSDLCCLVNILTERDDDPSIDVDTHTQVHAQVRAQPQQQQQQQTNKTGRQRVAAPAAADRTTPRRVTVRAAVTVAQGLCADVMLLMEGRAGMLRLRQSHRQHAAFAPASPPSGSRMAARARQASPGGRTAAAVGSTGG